jgi:hypothetical protein
MIGCLILGTFGAIVIAKLVRHRMGWAGCHGGGGFRHDGGFGGGGWHGWHHRHHHHRDFSGGWGGDHENDPFVLGQGRHRGGRGFVMGAILDHVRATPVQERAVRAAFEEFRQEVKRFGGGEARTLRQDVSSVLRKPAFDEVFLGELFARHDRGIEGVRRAFVGLMAKVHDALDDEQRGRLAELLEKGPRFWRHGFDW